MMVNLDKLGVYTFGMNDTLFEAIQLIFKIPLKDIDIRMKYLGCYINSNCY